MADSKRSKLTGEALEQLQQGVSLVFSRWYMLRMLVDHEWGDSCSRDIEASLFASVVNFFCHPKSNEPLYIDELEDLLLVAMDKLGLNDPSEEVEQVALKLMIMHEECLEGNYQSIQKLGETTQAKPVPHVPHVLQTSMSANDLKNDDEESMMVDSPINNEVASKDMEVDGWVTVTRKKSKGQRLRGE